MNCNNCNFKKSHFISAVREIKSGTTLLFFFNDEEYTYDDVAVFNEILNEHLIENTVIFMPASLVKGIKEETCN